MNRISRKLKRSNKVIRYLYYIICIFYIATVCFFLKSIASLKGIETFLRIIIGTFFIGYFIIYSFFNFLNLLQRKYKGLIATSFLSLLFILVFSIGSYYINFIYNDLSSMTERGELTYTSFLITLKDTEFSSELKVGIISEDTKSLDNELASDLYTKEKLSNETVVYEDYIKMLKDLYDGVIKGAFVPGNYVMLFKSEEGFENIESDTVVRFKYSEKKENEDLTTTSDKDFSEPLTFLLMGVDSNKDGLKENAAFNGDTLMLITINPETLNAVMLSIPRDTYVPIACRNNAYAKINSSAAYGSTCVINTVSNLLDVKIDYYVKINFKGVVELVDAVNGVEVDVEKPYFNTNNGVNYQGKVCEQNSDRLFGDKIVCMEPGLQTLNGEQALAYSRNRHQYIGSDLDRIRHQQQVVEALAGKILSFASIKDFQKILNAVSNNIVTNMDMDTILSGYKVVKNVVGNIITGDDSLSIQKAYLETYNLNVYVPSQGGNTSALGYYKDSLNDIKKALKISLGEEKEEAIKTFSFSANKTYEIKSPGKGIRSGSSGALMPDFTGKTISEAESFCKEHNISFKAQYVDEGSQFYNPNVAVGLIGNQSVHKNVLLSTVSDLRVYIVNTAPSRNTNNSSAESRKEKDTLNNILDINL